MSANNNLSKRADFMQAAFELPEGTSQWIELVSGNRVLAMKRHVARREAWVIDTETSKGKKIQYFLRIDRSGLKGRGGPWSLARETKIIQALESTAVPAQIIYAWDDERQLALQQMVPGKGELDQVPPDQQQAVFKDFLDSLAELHKLDPNALGISDVCDWPVTPADHALSEVRIIESLWQSMPAPNTVSRLFSAFGSRWLENHVPQEINHTVLVQGDTGPANFMFEGNKVTAFVDWELAHIGDPMEDLGNIVVRDFFYPSSGGNLQPLFEYYENVSGIKVDNAKVKYYTVQQLLRSVMSLMYTVSNLKWHDEVAMNMGYEINCQRAMCDAIARSMNISHDLSLSNSGMPAVVIDVAEKHQGNGALKSGSQTLFALAIDQLKKQIQPAQDDTYIKHRTTHTTALIEYLARLDCYGDALDNFEVNEIEQLMGRSFSGLVAAEDALLEWIENMSAEQDEKSILAYLYARAYRLEDLMEPLVRPFANRALAVID